MARSPARHPYFSWLGHRNIQRPWEVDVNLIKIQPSWCSRCWKFLEYINFWQNEYGIFVEFAFFLQFIWPQSKLTSNPGTNSQKQNEILHKWPWPNQRSSWSPFTRPTKMMLMESNHPAIKFRSQIQFNLVSRRNQETFHTSTGLNWGEDFCMSLMFRRWRFKFPLSSSCEPDGNPKSRSSNVECHRCWIIDGKFLPEAISLSSINFESASRRDEDVARLKARSRLEGSSSHSSFVKCSTRMLKHKFHWKTTSYPDWENLKCGAELFETNFTLDESFSSSIAMGKRADEHERVSRTDIFRITHFVWLRSKEESPRFYASNKFRIQLWMKLGECFRSFMKI